MDKIPVLKRWQLNNEIPSVYDTQSGSYQEMVAKVYGAMRKLQEEYNKMIDELNTTIENFIESNNADFDCFKKTITKICHDYIAAMDIKIENQDKIIADAVLYMKDHISQSLESLLVEMSDNGELNDIIINALTSVEESLTDMSDRISTMEVNFTNLENTLTEQVNNLDTDLGNVDNRVTNLENNKVTYTYDELEEEIELLNVGGIE